MLTPDRQRGISLVEAMVVLVITGVMLAAAMPSFTSWMAGSRIRATAEGVLAGLQYAKSEAATRNSSVRFQLTTTLDGACRRSTSNGNWVVDLVEADPAVDSVEGQCNAAPGDAAPGILQVRASAETGSSVRINADASQVIFSGLGRQVPTSGATAATVNIDVEPVSGVGKCVAAGGKVTCLRIVISPGGLVRMCNPGAASSDPQAC